MAKGIPHEAKPVFGISVDDSGYSLLIGLSEASWEYTKDGKTLTIDLAAAGLSLRLFLFGCKDQQAAKEVIFQHNKTQRRPSVDMTGGKDFGIKEGSQSIASLKGSVFK